MIDDKREIEKNEKFQLRVYSVYMSPISCLCLTFCNNFGSSDWPSESCYVLCYKWFLATLPAKKFSSYVVCGGENFVKGNQSMLTVSIPKYKINF